MIIAARQVPCGDLPRHILSRARYIWRTAKGEVLRKCPRKSQSRQTDKLSGRKANARPRPVYLDRLAGQTKGAFGLTTAAGRFREEESARVKDLP